MHWYWIDIRYRSKYHSPVYIHKLHVYASIISRVTWLHLQEWLIEYVFPLFLLSPRRLLVMLFYKTRFEALFSHFFCLFFSLRLITTTKTCDKPYFNCLDIKKTVMRMIRTIISVRWGSFLETIRINIGWMNIYTKHVIFSGGFNNPV